MSDYARGFAAGLQDAAMMLRGIAAPFQNNTGDVATEWVAEQMKDIARACDEKAANAIAIGGEQ